MTIPPPGCGPRCWRATSHGCACDCGGRFHGRDAAPGTRKGPSMRVGASRRVAKAEQRALAFGDAAGQLWLFEGLP